MTTRLRRADRVMLLAFAAANAALYSSLLPLWEGFDEPFHYGYVERLSQARRLPVLGETRISREVWESMLDAPASHVVQRAIPELRTFDAYFALPESERIALRREIESIPREPAVESARANYEAHQAPLAYVLLALPDWILGRASITVRVLWVRILGAIAGTLIAFAAAQRLFRALEAPAEFQTVGLLCIFACQMFWATVAHVANDWLALPLSIWFFAELALFARRPDAVGALRLALATALGLLAKAYFLPLAAVAGVAIAVRRRASIAPFLGIVAMIAGPWYVRNLALYGSLSATVESLAGVGPGQALSAADSVPWGRSILYMLRGALWTGNNSFVSFSLITLDFVLVLLAAGWAMQILRRRGPAELALWSAMAVYGAAVLYVTTTDFVYRHGTSAGASPWYVEALLAPALALSLAGFSLVPRYGRLAAAFTAALWAYVCVATYVVKLIPLYGGYEAGRATLSGMVVWYRSHGAALTSMLSTVSLAPPALLYTETAVVILLAVTLAGRAVAALWRARS